jgi:hypothetical protein
MSSDATSATPSKRKGFDPERTSSTQKTTVMKTKSSTNTKSPIDIARANLTWALASLDSIVSQFFEPFTTELLNLRMSKELGATKLKRFDEPNYLPKSIILKTMLKFSIHTKDSPEAQTLRTEMQEVIANFHSEARKVVNKAATLELTVTDSRIATTFMNIVIHTCSFVLIDNSITPQDEIVYLLAAYLIDRTDISVSVSSRNACFQKLQLRFPSKRLLTRDMDFDGTFMIQFSKFAKPDADIYTIVDKIVHKPWTAYNRAVKSEATAQAKSKYFEEQSSTTVAATATTAARTMIDSDLPVACEEILVKSIVERAVAKHSKMFERKCQSLENSIDQFKKSRFVDHDQPHPIRAKLKRTNNHDDSRRNCKQESKSKKVRRHRRS